MKVRPILERLTLKVAGLAVVEVVYAEGNPQNLIYHVIVLLRPPLGVVDAEAVIGRGLAKHVRRLRTIVRIGIERRLVLEATFDRNAGTPRHVLLALGQLVEALERESSSSDRLVRSRE
ncbi:MAG: hypothetical protein HYR74_09010 [Candidatus Eisenbacteria bacterium]|nr:hypothetical protein [Candidatus Eisenbacteria bacterium]